MKDYFKEKIANLFTSLRANIYFVYSTKLVLYKRGYIVYKVVKKLRTRKRKKYKHKLHIILIHV